MTDRTRAQRALVWITERLPARAQAEFVAFAWAVGKVNRELAEQRADRDGTEYTVGVWIRGLARSDFDRLSELVHPAPVNDAAWDMTLPCDGAARKVAFFVMGVAATSPQRAGVRCLDWLTDKLDEVCLHPVDAVRVEVEDRDRLARHVYVAEEDE